MSAFPAAWTAVASMARCLRLLRLWRPDIVIGFGGYVSLPLGLAAAIAGIPIVLHEQNAVPGLANRILSQWAAAVCVTYQASAQGLRRPARAVVSGNPVRPAVMASNSAAGRKALHLGKADLVLLVFGGSRGAKHLNSAIVDLYPRLSVVPKVKVVLVAGPDEAATVEARLKEVAGGTAAGWQVHGYLNDMGDALAAADLVVCRAGATTIAELTALGKPAVVVPYPYATDGHQRLNAQALVEAGAAVEVLDGDLDTPMFGSAVLRLLAERDVRERMGAAAATLARPLAAHVIAETALDEACAYRRRRGFVGASS